MTAPGGKPARRAGPGHGPDASGQGRQRVYR